MWLVTRSRNSSRTSECWGIPFITFDSASPHDFQEETRRSMSLRKRVGVGLYWVATGVGYHTVANLFGIAKSSVCAFVAHFIFFFRLTLCIKCDLAVQIAVAFKKIRYVSDSVPHLKVAWFWFENVRFNATCAVHTVKSKSDMGHMWAKKSYSGHLQLQCECSLKVIETGAASIRGLDLTPVPCN